MCDKLLVLESGKVSNQFSLEQRALCQFMRMNDAPVLIKRLLDKA
jgi:hypothetical protein